MVREASAGDEVFGRITPATPDTYGQVKERLGRLVAELADRGVTRLPPEDQLSTQLHVSRPTVRSALLALQKEGKIQRVHGRGTFINVYAARMQANLVEHVPFLELLEARGAAVAVRTLAVRVAALDPSCAARLERAAGADAVVVRRVFEADGHPAVLSVDLVPADRLVVAADRIDAGTSTFDFVRRNTNSSVRYSVADLLPAVPDAATAESLQLAAGEPVLVLDHLHIDERESPVAVTKAYIRDDQLRFSIVRIYGP